MPNPFYALGKEVAVHHHHALQRRWLPRLDEDAMPPFHRCAVALISKRVDASGKVVR